MRTSYFAKMFAGAAGIAMFASAALSLPAVAAASLIPALSSHNFYGYGNAKVSDATVKGEPFKTALTITNSAPTAQPWNSGAATPAFTSSVAKGDHLLVTLYIRAILPASAKAELSVELSNAPYTSSGRMTITAAKAWKKVTVPAVSLDNYTGPQIHVVFHTGYAKETVQVAGLSVVDKGK
jgi:hypothetical protein